MKQRFDDLYEIFQSEEFFLGVFENEHYRISRKYIDGQGVLQRLYYTKMEPLKLKPRASLVMIHGFGEHSTRLIDFAEAFVQQAYIIHFVDLRGFGYSGGARGNILIEEMILDVETCLKQADENLPLFLFGHSMGGLINLTIGCRNPDLKIAGFISSSALLGDPTDRKIDQFKKDGLRVAGEYLGDILINSMINVTSLTKNNIGISKIVLDPKNIPFLGIKMAKSLMGNIQVIQPSAKYFKYPLFIYHGQRDGITNYKDSIRFFNKASSEDKIIHIFPNGYHEMHHDVEVKDLERAILDWMEKRVSKAPNFSRDFKISLTVPSILTKREKYFRIAMLVFTIIYLYFVIRNWNTTPNVKTSFLKKLGLPLYFFIKNKLGSQSE